MEKKTRSDRLLLLCCRLVRGWRSWRRGRGDAVLFRMRQAPEHQADVEAAHRTTAQPASALGRLQRVQQSVPNAQQSQQPQEHLPPEAQRLQVGWRRCRRRRRRKRLGRERRGLGRRGGCDGDGRDVLAVAQRQRPRRHVGGCYRSGHRCGRRSRGRRGR